MIWLLAAILSTTSIGVVFKLAEPRTHERVVLLMGNYFLATLISLAMWSAAGAPTAIGNASFGLAIFGGVIFAFNFFLMMLAIRKRGVALPVILMRLSAVVPIAASVAFFSETPGPFNLLGLVGALIAASLLSLNIEGGMHAEIKGDSRLWLVLGSLGLLFLFGLADLTLKTFEHVGETHEKPLFLALLFATAFVILFATALIKRVRFSRNDLFWGFLLGAPNMLSAFFVVTALKELPAYLVFPIVSAGTVMLISLIAVLFFGERLTRWGVVGIGLTLVSIVLINLD